MKRIAFFSGDITRSGGTERVATVIANELAKRESYEVFCVSLARQNEKAAYPLAPSIACTFFSEEWISPGIGYLPVIGKLIRYLKRNRIDILIDIDGVLDVLSLPAKLVTHVRVVSWEHFHFFADLGTRYRKYIRRLAARYADAIVTLTESDRQAYCDHLKIRHTICAIHNPADYMEVSDEGRQKRDYDKKIIVSVGRLAPEKGFLQVPAIAACLRRKYPALEFSWLIAGEGEQREQIEAAIAQHNVSEQVRLLGEKKEVSPLYQSALLYVMTSEFEGLPMVLLEAKLHGLPCVSFDIRTGPAEIIEDGVSGYLIPTDDGSGRAIEQMADAIGRLLTDRELWERFCAHSQDNIGEFRLQTVIKKWETLLESL